MSKYSVNKNMNFNTKSLVAMGVLTAIEIILSRFVSIQAWNIKIGFGFVPVVIAAITLGPIKAGIVGALADFLGANLFPIGTYFPGFTLTAFLSGMVYGLFLHKRQNYLRIFIAVGVNQIIFSLLINTLWISILYGTAYLPLIATRAIQSVIMIPVHLVFICIICRPEICRILDFQH